MKFSKKNNSHCLGDYITRNLRTYYFSIIRDFCVPELVILIIIRTILHACLALETKPVPA